MLNGSITLRRHQKHLLEEGVNFVPDPNMLSVSSPQIQDQMPTILLTPPKREPIPLRTPKSANTPPSSLTLSNSLFVSNTTPQGNNFAFPSPKGFNNLDTPNNLFLRKPSSAIQSKSVFEGLPGFKKCHQEQFEYAPPKDEKQQRKMPAKYSKDIEERSINAAKSYRFFEDSILRKPSLTIGQYKRNSAVYEADLRDYKRMNMVAAMSAAIEESPIEKYQRLKQEIDDFIGEMGRMSVENPKARLVGENVSVYSEILEQSRVLKQKLETVKDTSSCCFVEPKNEDESTQLLSQIQSELDQALQGQINSLVKPEVPKVERVPPKQEISQDSARVLRLERRLAYLEKLVGTEDERKNIMVKDKNSTKKYASIEAVINALEKKVNTIDPFFMQSLESRIKNILKDLENISTLEVVNSSSISFNGTKIENLYQRVRKWDELTKQVPMIVSRLQTLKIVHDEAIYFAGTVSKLKQQQEELSGLLDGNEKLLANIATNFDDNLVAINKNIKLIQSRIEHIKK